MINVRDKIIEELYEHLQLPIRPNGDTKKRPGYPYVSYAITTVIVDPGEGNVSIEDAGEDVILTLSLQNKISFSFTAYSRDEAESFNTIKLVQDWFRHIGVETLSDNHIAVVDVMNIDNRTILEVNKYEMRYGCDVIVRYDDVIERTEITIDEYSIEKE